VCSDKAATEPAFFMEKVSFHYPGGEIGLREIDLTIARGERIVLLGANGSGKSTLLKVLDGLIFPQQGVVRAFGRTLDEKHLKGDRFNHWFRQQVGFVFQNSEAQLFSSNVWEEIAFGPLHLGLDQAEVRERVTGMLDFFDLGRVKDRPPFKLSGGEKRKVALAAVLAVNPGALMLDEPTGGLDPRTQRWLIDMLIRLGEAGKTLIAATHDLEIVEEIADRVLVFSEDHCLVAGGTPDEILSDKDLLLRVNLIDPRFHRHAHGGDHRHYHCHEQEVVYPSSPPGKWLPGRKLHGTTKECV
jgi:cobalt/nickel transport system ATP-binding protein